MSLTPGQRLGAYEVVAALGAGGMGEVYRARDNKLGRDVAIKVLPSDVAADAGRLARFKREAQLLAALNHPNIAAIHGLDEADGQMFLVLELVEGEDLSEIIARHGRRAPAAAAPSESASRGAAAHGGGAPRALDIDDALQIATQISLALEEAHAKGIVHRDLKPANIKVTPAGKVKVLDFGLAKAYSDDPGGSSGDAAHSPTMTSPAMTARGMILGTAAYMSPEQARGKAVDKRADIWAFGCVLYEMLTGTPAFPGETVTDILAAVVKNEPAWSALPAETPRAVHTVLRRCLRKDPAQRLHDMADARLELQDAEPAPAAGAAATGGRRASPRWLVPALVAALAIGAAAGAFWRGAQVGGPEPFIGVRLGGPSAALHPRVSPDGQLLAFLAMVDGLTQVAVMKPGTGNWTVLTSDRSRGLIDQLVWSPDGSKIYFDRRTDGPTGIFSVPALGGDERLVVENATAPLALADGTLLFLRINADRRYQLHRLSPGTGQLDPLPMLAASDDIWAGSVQLLRDGRILMVGVPQSAPGATSGLYTFSLDASGEFRQVGPRVPVDDVRSMAVRPGDGAVFVVVREASTYRILQYPADLSGEPRALMTLLSAPRITASPDGTIYASVFDRPGEVLRFGEHGESIEALATNLMAGQAAGAIGLDDGRVIVGTRAGGGGRVVAVTPGKEPTALVDTDEDTWAPVTSTGAGRVALLVGRLSAPAIAIVAVDTGRVLKRLPAPPGITSLAASPDGKTLYYGAGGKIVSLPIDGGTSAVIGDGNSVTVDPESGDLIAMLQELDRFRLARIPAGGGSPRPIAITGNLRLVEEPLTSGAVRRGKLLVPVATADSWFWFAGVLDLNTGGLEKIGVNHQTDFHFLTWTPDGRVLGTGLGLQSALWKFAPAGR